VGVSPADDSEVAASEAADNQQTQPQGLNLMSLTVRNIAILIVIALAVSCRKSQTAADFDSREQAESALIRAARAGDQSALIEIFGPDSKAVLFMGDAEIDRARVNDFVTAYDEMHRWGKLRAGGDVLIVGLDNQPFPIPLDKKPSGRWYFDTAAGKDEILARRIGKNELTAMDACRALAASPNPRARLGDFAKASKAEDVPEFNGYRYRILSKPGSFAILAYPAEYRNSGIMSFLIADNGTLYQKDLGGATGTLAAALTTYNPADNWAPATT
jgi:hypothetical protein